MRIHARVSDTLGEQFRKRVAEIYGNKKGALSKAIEEAMILWLKHTEFLVEAKKVRENATTTEETE